MDLNIPVLLFFLVFSLFLAVGFLLIIELVMTSGSSEWGDVTKLVIKVVKFLFRAIAAPWKWMKRR